MASSSVRVTMMPPCDASACRAGPSDRQLILHLAATAGARRRLGVIRIARASGSCSACAMRSAAIHAGLPDVERTAISLGPAKKSIAQSRETSDLAAAT